MINNRLKIAEIDGVKSKVSIIMPVYNGEFYLKNTIENILASVYENIELIVIDDGSFDNSKDICMAYAENDKRIFYYYKENGGIASARNKGIEVCTGDLICFCDQDDIVFKETYITMKRHIEESGSDICICSTGRWVDDQIIPYEILKYKVCEKKQIVDSLLSSLLLNPFVNNGGTDDIYIYPNIWKCMMRRKIIIDNELQFKKFINYEDDLLMLFDVLCVSEKIVTIPDILYCWRLNYASETYRLVYITDLEEKQMRLFDYIFTGLKKCQVNDQMLTYYQSVQMCRFYLQSLENETSRINPKRLRGRIKFLKASLYDTKSRKHLNVRKFLKTGQYKNKIILFCLEKGMIYTAYVFLVMYNNITKIAMRNKFVLYIERKLKHII